MSDGEVCSSVAKASAHMTAAMFVSIYPLHGAVISIWSFCVPSVPPHTPIKVERLEGEPDKHNYSRFEFRPDITLVFKQDRIDGEGKGKGVENKNT